MAIRDISLGTARPPHNKAFNSSTWAVTQLYAAHVPDFDSAGIVKLAIAVQDAPGATASIPQDPGPVLRLLNVATVEVPLDLAWYAELPDSARTQLQLELVHAACLAICAAQQWSIQPFQEAYAQCLRANLTNAWVMNVGKRFAFSQNRRFKACLVCLWTVRTFRVELVVLAKATGGAQVTLLLENEAHDPVTFYSLSWVDHQTVKATARYPNREWQVKVDFTDKQDFSAPEPL